MKIDRNIPGTGTGLQPGVYHLDPAEYYRDPCPLPSLNASTIKTLLTRSPRHAWTESRRLNPDWEEPDPKEAFEIGSASHAVLLGRGSDLHCVLADNWATKAAKSARDEARASGKVPLLAHQYEQALKRAAVAHERLRELGVTIDPTRSELTAVAVVDGVWCRILVDNAPAWADEDLLDFKTCDDASLDGCRRAVERYRYDVQEAHYKRVWHEASDERRGFQFFFQEKRPPFECSLVRLHDVLGDGDWMERAEDDCAAARKIWRTCIETGRWPGYPARRATLFASKWHRDQTGALSSASAEVLGAAREWQAPIADADPADPSNIDDGETDG